MVQLGAQKSDVSVVEPQVGVCETYQALEPAPDRCFLYVITG
jgi:hypothetical protein